MSAENCKNRRICWRPEIGFKSARLIWEDAAPDAVETRDGRSLAIDQIKAKFDERFNFLDKEPVDPALLQQVDPESAYKEAVKQMDYVVVQLMNASKYTEGDNDRNINFQVKKAKDSMKLAIENFRYKAQLGVLDLTKTVVEGRIKTALSHYEKADSSLTPEKIEADLSEVLKKYEDLGRGMPSALFPRVQRAIDELKKEIQEIPLTLRKLKEAAAVYFEKTNGLYKAEYDKLDVKVDELKPPRPEVMDKLSDLEKVRKNNAYFARLNIARSAVLEQQDNNEKLLVKINNDLRLSPDQKAVLKANLAKTLAGLGTLLDELNDKISKIDKSGISQDYLDSKLRLEKSVLDKLHAFYDKALERAQQLRKIGKINPSLEAEVEKFRKQFNEQAKYYNSLLKVNVDQLSFPKDSSLLGSASDVTQNNMLAEVDRDDPKAIAALRSTVEFDVETGKTLDLLLQYADADDERRYPPDRESVAYAGDAKSYFEELNKKVTESEKKQIKDAYKDWETFSGNDKDKLDKWNVFLGKSHDFAKIHHFFLPPTAVFANQQKIDF